MNQVFDLKRWLFLVNKHWGENRKKYLLSLVALLALMVIWYIFVVLIERHSPYSEEMQVGTYFIGMTITGCLFGSFIFSEAASGPKAMHFMSVPASIVEKLLSAFLFAFVLFFICYTVIFYIVDYTMVNLSNSILENYWKERNPEYVFKAEKVINVFSRPVAEGSEIPPIFFWFLVMYFNIQSAFILGSVYFPGYSFIKTCISLLAIFLIVIFYMAQVLDGFMPPGHFGEGFFTFIVPSADEDTVRGVSLPNWMANTIKYLFMFGFLPLIWLATYFRLKEKEV